jgi:hypothetical protein
LAFKFNLRRFSLATLSLSSGTFRTLNLGRAVQVDPVKPALKPLGTKRLKLIYDGPLSKFAFKLSLHRYTWARARAWSGWSWRPPTCTRWTSRGAAVKVEPMKPVLIGPGSSSWD